jgi:hypothetical protein
LYSAISNAPPRPTKEIGCQAKVIGALVSLGGALLMALYTGLVVQIVGSSAATQMHQLENVNDPAGAHWLLGALFTLIGCVGIFASYILQVSSHIHI